jgi:hypothetical protein
MINNGPPGSSLAVLLFLGNQTPVSNGNVIERILDLLLQAD